MKENTKKILWLVAIAAVIILIIALKKKQEEYKENEGEEAGAKIPYVGLVSGTFLPVNNGTETTDQQQDDEPQGEGKNANTFLVPAQLIPIGSKQPFEAKGTNFTDDFINDPVRTKGINYFDANCR